MRLEIDDTKAGERLDGVLAGPLGSRAKAQRLIDAGLVTVDGQAKPKRHRVRTGEVVEVADEPPAPAPGRPADVPLAIAYEDDALLVVDKPPGLVVHPAPGHPTGTLAQALGPGAGIVHRLDRDTSGLLVVAKAEETTLALQRAIQRRDVQ